MSTYQVQDEVPPSPSLHRQKGHIDDDDSGFDELIDDAATFELLPLPRRSTSPQSPLQNHVASPRSPANNSSADSAYVTPEYSPISPSPSPRSLPGNESVSSSVSTTSTQPDGGVANSSAEQGETSGVGSGVTFSYASPISPTGSEEDVSEKESDDAFEDAGGSSPEEDELGEQWNPDFYNLQRQAPQPQPVLCTKEIDNKPLQYGLEYHGNLSREEAMEALGFSDGCYLVRSGSDGVCILSFMLGGRMWNFKLFYEDGVHYVGEKRFDDITDLVQDGLISLYLSQHNALKTLEIGRDVTRRHSQRLRRKPCGRGKGPKGRGKSAYLERLHSGSVSPLLPPSKSAPRLHSCQSVIEFTPITPNSNHQQSDLDTTTLRNRHGNSTSTLLKGTSTPATKSRRAFSTESLQHQNSTTSPGSNNNRCNPITTLRDAVREERKENFSQSVEVSILSEKAASILGIAPPKHYKRASSYDPLTLQKARSDGMPHQPRSYSFHPGLKRGKTIDKVNPLPPRDGHKLTRKPPASPSPYYKAHKFKPLTYVHPTWCVICHHFLWGLKMQGLRCQDCGIDIHRQCCAGSLDHECNPTKKMVKRMYGVDLTTRVKVEDTAIPNLLTQCIEHIEKTELEAEGLYRVSGQTSELLELKEKFDSGDKIDFSRYTDINIVCGAVKLYLRELPIPVVTFDAYNEVMKATSTISDPNGENVDWTVLANALKLLPKAHYNVLKYLVEHLQRVDEKSSINKMTAYNLSVVFAPTLMRSPSEDMSLVKDITLQRHFVEMLILKHNILFN